LTAVVQETLQSGEPYLIDLECSVGAGARRWVQARGEVVRNASGQIEGLRGTVQDITDRKRDEETLQRYAHRLIALEEELRKKVSRELHDDIGQELTALGLNLAHIDTKLQVEAGGDLRATLADSRKLTKEISRSVRNLMVELRPTQLEEYGLTSAIRSYGNQFQQRTGIAVAIQAAPEFPRLTSRREINLFRLTQEALTNIAKHAFATRVSIELECNGASACLKITDDGKGFLRQSAASPVGSGWGLTIMRERAELVGASFQLKTEPGAGTSIIIEMKEVC